jgi:serine/threonine protein kinase
MVKRYKPSGESLFTLEKAILQELDHPGTIKFIGECVTPDGRQYFVLKKPTTSRFTLKRLGSALRDFPLSTTKFLNLALQMTSTVHYLHAKLKVLHRDLGVDTWLIHNENVVLADFSKANKL